MILTFFALEPLNPASAALKWVLFADFVYILIAAGLVLRSTVQSISQSRANSAGSRLHLRLTGVFSLVALVPTVLVAVFAMLTVNAALDGWFSSRVQSAISASEDAARAYKEEQTTGLVTDARLLAGVLNFRHRREFLDDGELRAVLGELEPGLQRPVKEIYIVNNLGDLRVRGPNSYQFDFEPPTADAISAAVDAPFVIEDLANGELRVLFRLQTFSNHYLYMGRSIDANLLQLLTDTTATAQTYQTLEERRGNVLFEFGVYYLAFAVILILAAILAGLRFADHLAGPIGALTAAAQRVGDGDLDVRVSPQKGTDEIATLGRYFNKMTGQIKDQRENLVQNALQIDRRRRLFDSVLSSVTSGVLGVDKDGLVTFVNRSAQRLLLLDAEVAHMRLEHVVPEFVPLFQQLDHANTDTVSSEIKVIRGGKQETLLVRIAARETDDHQPEGYVIAFDDVTDLVSAQRLAAWGDVARRIAHEVKNPLTPIKLSAERIKRKFAPKVGEDSDQLENMTNVIMRQTDDLRRIVDDFSKFARMPEPQTQNYDLADVIQGAVLLQDAAFPDVTFDVKIEAGESMSGFDPTLIGQALTNLIKNAAESVQTRLSQIPEPKGRVTIHLSATDRCFQIKVFDNGLGLPADRAQLLEPYVTHRDGGTGLGLPIVLKIIEEHGGTLRLLDAPEGQGALIEIQLPKSDLAVQNDAALRSMADA
ncbi:MAG: ATP-binding protein [Planktomarina sp.]